jgi:ribonucleoside-diphosphate reductase alpha subunit
MLQSENQNVSDNKSENKHLMDNDTNVNTVKYQSNIDIINQKHSVSSGNDRKFYLSDGNKINILTREFIYDYVSSICRRMSIEHLDVNRVILNVYPKLKTINTIKEIREQIIMSTTEMVIDHFDYPSIAMCILIDELHQKTHDDYLKVVKSMRSTIDKRGKKSPIVSKDFYEYVKKHRIQINSAFRYDRDYKLSIFGFRTLEKNYLKKNIKGEVIERPQHLFMRVAIAIHYRNNRIDRIIETYELLSSGYFVHATPTLFNAGTTREQLSSCFLLGIDDDIAAIGDCLKNCMLISKYAGGLGINVTNIRVAGAYINSTQGGASGLRILLLFNQIARYVDQGGKRPGSIAIYLEPWHGDIFFFLDLKKNTGAETERARDLFLGLMINDIFMQRVKEDGIWSLMCPYECPNLLNKYGTEFNKVYINYEKDGRYLKQIRARDLWFKIMESQIETGVPYIMFKDTINYKSNQINIGVINGSNLCAEIVEVSTSDNYSVCNLASICLPKFVTIHDGLINYDYQKLFQVVKVVTRNLNNIIDINYYPVENTKVTNLRDRPIGIGVQGLADVFLLFKTPFDSQLARDLNKKIFETIYYAALTESMEIAMEEGPYQTYYGSPISQGKFQFDLWNLDRKQLCGMWDWDGLMAQIQKYGVRNSLVTACMPTASTSQIMGWNETIEPYTENIYTRSTLAGDFYVINKYLMKDLMELNLWNQDMIDMIKFHHGSVSKITQIPEHIKKIYRTVWEIPQKSIIEMAADRGPFVDQTQSMNIFIEKASFAKLNSCLFYAWEKGLKTGIYYLRSKPASDANQFGIDIDKIKEIESKCHDSNNSKASLCLRSENLQVIEHCLVCGS